MFERNFIFNGKKSTDFNLLIQNDFQVEGGDQDVSYSQIPGRNLDLVNSNDRNENGSIKYECFIDVRWFKRGLYSDLAELRRDLTYWLQVSENFTSYVKLVDNLDEDYFYLARLAKLPRPTYLNPKYAKVTIEFNVGPDKFRNDGSFFKTINLGQQIINPEPLDSYPIIKIKGTGPLDLVINGVTYKITEIGGLSYINSEKKRIYDDQGLKNNIGIFPDYQYPKFKNGINDISWNNNDVTVEIQPNWRMTI